MGAIKGFAETYIPGFGIVDSTNAFYLPEPVEYTEEGVTLKVEQVFIGHEEAFVLVDFINFPGEDYPDLYHVFLRLPDGQEIGSGGRAQNSVIYSPDNIEINLNFPGMSEPVDQLTLVWRTPYGMFQKAYWEIPLRLSPVKEYETKTAVINYQPEASIASSAGVDIRINSVSENSQYTAVEIYINSPVEYGKPSDIMGAKTIWLEDESGRRYEMEKNILFANYADDPLEPEIVITKGISYYALRRTITFAPLAGNPEELILHVAGVSISKDIVLPLQLEFDDSPTIIAFQRENIPVIIADSEVVITGIDLVQSELDKNIYYHLKLRTNPLPDKFQSVDFLLYSDKGTYLDWWSEADLPKNQEIRLNVMSVFARLNGNWEIRWTRP